MDELHHEQASPIFAAADDPLGPLADLPGTWTGFGYNVIGLPDFHDRKSFRVLVNATSETLTFEPTKTIVNRGDSQDDISLAGVTYLQTINDQSTGQRIHIEPGIWLNIPATTSPPGGPSVVRQSSIPHGTTLLAQGTSYTDDQAPFYPQASPLARPVPGGPPLTIGYNAPYRAGPFPGGYDPDDLNKPLKEVLRQQITTEKMVCQSNTALSVSTIPFGGISNIPFLKTNAEAIDTTATFNIERMVTRNGVKFLQLQYTQTVNIIFGGMIWPHISVATLTKR